MIVIFPCSLNGTDVSLIEELVKKYDKDYIITQKALHTTSKEFVKIVKNNCFFSECVDKLNFYGNYIIGKNLIYFEDINEAIYFMFLNKGKFDILNLNKEI